MSAVKTLISSNSWVISVGTGFSGAGRLTRVVAGRAAAAVGLLGPAPFVVVVRCLGVGTGMVGRVGRAGAGFFAGGWTNASSAGARFLFPFRTSAARGWVGGSGAREGREPLAVGGTARVVRMATDFVAGFVERGIVIVFLAVLTRVGVSTVSGSDGFWERLCGHAVVCVQRGGRTGPSAECGGAAGADNAREIWSEICTATEYNKQMGRHITKQLSLGRADLTCARCAYSNSISCSHRG